MVKQVDTPRVKSRYEYRFHEEQKRRGRIDDDSIVRSITSARQKAAIINKEVDRMIYEHDREVHLMRHFLIDNLRATAERWHHVIYSLAIICLT